MWEVFLFRRKVGLDAGEGWSFSKLSKVVQLPIDCIDCIERCCGRDFTIGWNAVMTMPSGEIDRAIAGGGLVIESIPTKVEPTTSPRLRLPGSHGFCMSAQIEYIGSRSVRRRSRLLQMKLEERTMGG